MEDVLEQVQWARSNDEAAERMAENAVSFAVNNLLPDHLYCYMVRLLKVRESREWAILSGGF